MSLSPVLYSTPDGCAAIGDKGFDAVWAAVPGNCDPSTVFAPTFMPGNVAAQCGQASFSGVSYDISVSEFSFGGTMADLNSIQTTADDIFNFLFFGSSGDVQGAPFSTQRLNDTLTGVQQVQTKLDALLSTEGVEKAAIDALAANAAAASALAAVKAELDTVEGQITSSAPVDLTALKTGLDTLSKHLGVGTA